MVGAAVRWVVGWLVLASVSGCLPGESSESAIAVEGRELIAGNSEAYVKIAGMQVPGDRQPGVGEVCFNSTRVTRCLDTTGHLTQAYQHDDADEERYLWISRTGYWGEAVYQPKDDGRVFFMHRTSDGVMFWVVYDPQGRDLPGWLRAQGFTDVGSYNENFAWAGRIVDQQKRHDFWIWVQARQSRIAEFETKYPHLAAPELDKTPR